MKKENIKVILDTNLLISFLISKKRNFLQPLFIHKEIQLIISEELLAEFMEVIKRPKFRNYFSEEQAIVLLNLLEERALFVETINLGVDDCRDSKDNFLLSLAKQSNAYFLITGDKDLLELDPYQSTRITTITHFQEIIK